MQLRALIALQGVCATKQLVLWARTDLYYCNSFLQVYAVYQEHIDLVRQYACMLWSELDVSGMMAGTDEVGRV